MNEIANEPAKRMRLFVAGEISGNPSDWYSHHMLVLAESPEQARGMVDFTTIIREVQMDSPALLV